MTIESDVEKLRDALHEAEVDRAAVTASTLQLIDSARSSADKALTKVTDLEIKHVVLPVALDAIRVDIKRVEDALDKARASLKEDIKKLEAMAEEARRTKIGLITAIIVAVIAGTANIVAAVLR